MLRVPKDMPGRARRPCADRTTGVGGPMSRRRCDRHSPPSRLPAERCGPRRVGDRAEGGPWERVRLGDTRVGICPRDRRPVRAASARRRVSSALAVVTARVTTPRVDAQTLSPRWRSCSRRDDWFRWKATPSSRSRRWLSVRQKQSSGMWTFQGSIASLKESARPAPPPLTGSGHRPSTGDRCHAPAPSRPQAVERGARTRSSNDARATPRAVPDFTCPSRLRSRVAPRWVPAPERTPSG